MPAYPNPLLNPDAIDEQTDPGLLRQLGGVGLSGVAAVGNVLDLPGSAIRDVLALRNPFDQWLPWNWTSSEGRTSGRDLLRQYGLVGKEDTYGNWWGGFAGEVALDPLTYLGAGALLKGAQAGTTGAKGLLRASVPFTKHAVELGTGARAQAVAKELGGLGAYLTKPSILAPRMESAAKYFTGKLPTSLRPAAQAGEEAAEEGIEFTRTFKPPAPTSKPAFFSTLSTDALLKEKGSLEEAIKAAGKDATTNAIERAIQVTQEIGRRSGGSPTTTLEELARQTPGELGRVDIAPTPIEQIASVVPNAPAPVAPWASKTAELLTAPGRAAAMLLHAPVRGTFSEEAQSLARQQWEKVGKAEREALEEATKFVDDYHEIETTFAKDFGTELGQSLPPDLAKSVANVSASVRSTLERVIGMAAETGDVPETFKFFQLAPEKSPQLLDKIGGLTTRMKDVNRKVYQSYLEMGGQGSILPKIESEALPELAEVGSLPGFEHFPRFGAEHPDNILRLVSGGLTRAQGSMARLEPLRAVPREIVERVGKLVHTMNAQKLGEREQIMAVADKYGKWLNRETQTIKQVVDGEEVEEVIAKWGTPEKHAEALVKWAQTADNYSTYLNDNLKAESRYLRGLMTARANIGGIHEVIKGSLGRRPLEAALDPEALPKGVKQLRGLLDTTEMFGDQPIVMVADAFERSGMNVEKSLRWLAKELGDSSDEAVAQLKDHGAIPDAVAQAIVGSRKVESTPGWAQAIGEVVDIPTRWFKENVTLPFASFAARNLASGQYLAAASGVLENFSDLKLYGTKLKESFEAFRSGQISPEMQREWFVNGVLHEDMLFEGVQTRLGTFGHVAPDPISVPDAWFEAGQQIEPSVLDRIPGLRTARQTQGTVLNTGAKVNRFVEYLNRVPLYETLKAKGWSAEAASKKVAELQVDYGRHNFSPFENEVMRRLVPFYSWQRSIGPVIIGSLLRQPTGLMGQSIRANRLASSEDPRTPEWLSGTLAIENPLGSSEPGGRSYITGFGLPYESTLAYFGGGVRGAGREFLSQLNPLVKAPLEWSTGQSFFQTGPEGTGRPLVELNPPIGQTLANIAGLEQPVDLPDALEFAAANSPLSRYLTTARQVTDPRKSIPSLAANLLTGVRVSDVSPGAQDAILRQRADALLKQVGGRTFTRTYLPESADLSSEEQGLAEQLAELQRLLDQRGRARKAELATQ